jgi:MOSC domain-containing protein
MPLIVSALWRYPVKSMLGERCQHLDIGAHGAVGDRLYAVRDAEGKLGSGKNSRRHRRLEGLLGFTAAYKGEVPTITFPDGRDLLASDAAIHTALSAVLRAPVTLAREGEVPHHDAEPIHLVTTGSLERLGADARRFRPNLVIDTPEDEAAWEGRIVRVGEATLKVAYRTERCVMITMAQSELRDEPQLLRRLSIDGAEPLFGVYAEVLSSGRIKLGDRVFVE